MKLVIDFQGAQACNSQRGIGRYSRAVVSEICKKYSKEFDIHLLVNGAFLSEGLTLKKSFRQLIPKENFHVFFPCTDKSKDLMSIDDFKRTEVVREALLERINPQIVLLTSLFEGLVDNAVVTAQNPDSKYKTAVVLYDLIPLLYPDIYLSDRKSKLWYKRRIEQLEKIDCVLTISEHTKNTAKKYLKILDTKLFNISGAVDHSFFSCTEETVKENFIFTVSGVDPRKNLRLLIRSFSRAVQLLKPDYKLIITCDITKEAIEKIKILMKELKLDHHKVIFTGYVSDKEILKLYKRCSLFVFPSWQEGFGLPILEAMACGAPVLAANAASLPEIGGDSVIYFDPFDSEDLANKIISALAEPITLFKKGLNNAERARNFKWSKVAEKSIQAIKKTLSEFSSTKPKMFNSRKPSLAYFSPMPPDKSGVAEYSSKLSQELTKYYDVTVINSLKDSKSERTKNPKSVSRDNFLANSGSYDRVLYHFGNSHFHVEMFDLLMGNPGVSVLHDFFLGGVISIRADQYDLICKNHGYKAIKKITETTSGEFLQKNPANLSVFENSYGVIVHSAYALDLVGKWYGKLAMDKSAVIPLFRSKAVGLSREKAREGLRIDQNQFVIASFGHLGPNKLNDRLLNIWLNSSLSRSSQLVFVGQAGSSEFDINLANKIKKLSKNFQVHCTGWTDNNAYEAWLSSVDIAIQLRTNTRGETSAAVLDCLSYSIPTIVNAHGDLSSLPENTVLTMRDNFSDHELTGAMENLFSDLAYRSKLAKEGSKYVNKNHNIEYCGQTYFEAIENFYTSKFTNIEGIFRHLKNNNFLPKNYLCKFNLVKSLSISLDTVPRIKKYFIDVSELVNRDARTGIQRVVRNILRCLLLYPPRGYLVEPVYANNETLGYRRATKFIENFLKLPHISQDEFIDPGYGDIFLGLDLQPKVVVSQKKYLDMLYLKGVSIQFFVYDLIPVNYPNFFPEGAKLTFDSWLKTICNYDQLISISNSTKIDVENWLKKNSPDRLKSLTINKVNLSSELDQEDRTVGDPKNAWFIRNVLEHRDVFLMVGTLEPRKEHSQVLDAFELMWAEQKEKKLLIVGKKGWCVENLSKRIKNHEQFNKNLIWLEDCSDEFLLELYCKSKGLIASSWAEGYGLPLVESYKSGLSVFCRDIPVFREVADKFATFFTASSPESFLKQFQEWDKSIKREVNPKSEQVESICWKKATKELEKITVKNVNL